MLSAYEEYQSMPDSLTWEEMLSLQKEMAEEIGSEEDALALYMDLLTAAVKYSESRSNWPLWDREKKLAEDSVRTRRHNRVIDCFNILARYLNSKGKTAAWRNILSDEKENPVSRKRIGDFACCIVFVESLNAR